MEEIGGEGSLSISEIKERPPVPPGSYDATYEGLKVFTNNGFKGVQKIVSLRFIVTTGPEKGRTVFFKGQMYPNDSGNWIVGSKSRLAEAIRSITGKDTIDATHKKTPVIVTVKHNKAKKPSADGTFRTYVEVDTIVARPNSERVAPQTQAQEARREAIPAAAPAKTGSAPAAKNGDLLDSLTDLGDFNL